MKNELFLIVWDVQHGSAAYMKTPNSKHIAFDLGTGSLKDSNQTFSPLLHLKKKWKVTQLDQTIITHQHRDHIDDIFNFDDLSPKVLRRPKHLTETEIRGDSRNTKGEQSKIDKYFEISARYNTPVPAEKNPTEPDNNGGVDFKFFQPTKCNRDNINNHSLVTVVTYLGWKMIIPGDNEQESWEELLAMPGFKKAIAGTNVLLASHHGRENGFSEELFKFIEPSLVIISDGPVGTTCARDKYFNKTKTEPCKVWVTSKGDVEDRWVLTTRNDKSIRLRIGYNAENETMWIVEID
jgi:beta-lactamase superfamily II metal-dependent hydrolase